jgi:protein SCO1/2
MERRHLWWPIALGIILAATLASCGEYRYRAMASIDEPIMAPDFTLTDYDGAPFALNAQRGSIVLLFFGFTSCPDVCPTTLAELAAVRKNLGADAERVRTVVITVDPERDTAAQLKRYVQVFDPAAVGLLADRPALEAVYRDYGVVAQRRDLPDSALGYTIDHTSAVYVIDAAGRWVGLFGYGAPVGDITADLQHLLAAR